MNYVNGLAPIVTVYGPGNLHHMTYGSSVSANAAVVGMISTPNEGTTNFLLGFSYNYPSYAFYWDGKGPAFWRISGNSTFREPVGSSWTNATGVPWGDEVILGLNVAAQASAAGNVRGAVPVFFSAEEFD
ncbi:hypothetical protein B0H16DRAFT_1361664 [Mycena metata]|uniref:Uncharacterized protein n=1 Tax=Mycena metata TaxID=1033252 RepID=A0AAD7K091_9AGAR|nr:hypothetical protein B0H16DRAFT_1361664 [Mycena metata]